MILNSFFIVPILTHLLNTKEVSIYMIVLQILNFICTMSFDWIAKAVMRYYEKYNLQEKQTEFLSTIFWLSIFVYILILIIYWFANKILITKFAITNFIVILLILLVIPCGIRQALYQILRAKNLYMLYTGSIILYQILFLICFLAFVNILPNASSLILAMIIGISFIDLYIFHSLNLYSSIKFNIDLKILKEALYYALPLVVTSLCYWALFHTPKLIFQMNQLYLYTSVFGIAWTLATNTLNPIATLFMFVNFPVIIKNFERNKTIKPYVTSMIQMYLYVLLPLLIGICIFSKDIIRILLPPQYALVAKLLPVFSIVILLHEMMKLLNIKYHLQNKTYIETSLGSLIIGLYCVYNAFSPNLTPNSAAALMLCAETVLIFLNILIKFKNLDFINYFKVSKTALKLMILAGVCGSFTILVFNSTNNIICIAKILSYLAISYFLLYYFRKIILS